MRGQPWRLCGWVLVVSAASCGRDAAAPQPPGEAGPPPATEDGGPPEIEHAYVSDDHDDDDDAATTDPDGGETDASSMEPRDDSLTVETAAALVTDAIDAATDPYAERLVTPALPASWPLSGSELVYYVYPLEPEEQGVARYRAFAPAFVVRLDVAARTTKVEPQGPLGKSGRPRTKAIGTFEHPRVRRDDAEAKAEQALLDLAAGRVEADKVRYLLHGYGKWFDRHGKIGSDAEARATDFAAWARAWGQR